MTGLNPKAAYTLKLGRAEKHLNELRDALFGGHEGEPYIPVRDRQTDPNPRVWIYRAHLISQPQMCRSSSEMSYTISGPPSITWRPRCSPKSQAQRVFPHVRERHLGHRSKYGEQVATFEDSRANWNSWVKGMDPAAIGIIKQTNWASVNGADHLHPFVLLNQPTMPTSTFS